MKNRFAREDNAGAIRGMRKRIKNIIRRMLNREDFYTNMSPRISLAEIDEIEELLGVLLQLDYVHGAEAGSPRAVYPLKWDEFEEKAKEKLEQ